MRRQNEVPRRESLRHKSLLSGEAFNGIAKDAIHAGRVIEGVRRRCICSTSGLPNPSEYTLALNQELSRWAFDEMRAPLNRGKWRERVFQKEKPVPLDLEIGTGNGLHIAHHALKNPDRLVVGIELKYKPLVQSIRRIIRGCEASDREINGALARFHAFDLDLLFSEGEIQNIFIHFPDPWTSPRKPKNRVMGREVLHRLSGLQRPGSFLEFKTDSQEYFDWALEEIKGSPYQVQFQSRDWHQEFSKFQNETPFITQFEQIFISRGQPILLARLSL